jgi:hypothetical protein
MVQKSKGEHIRTEYGDLMSPLFLKNGNHKKKTRGDI